MSTLQRPAQLLTALGIGVLVQLIGRGIDFRWHATHDEFETAADQLQAHWVLWVGALITLAVSSAALRRGRARSERLGYVLVLAGSIGYLAAALWHFLEHLAENESTPAHVAVAATWGVLLVGVVVTAVMWRRAQARLRPQP
jgi:lipopolysaccharide export LptBFGC system permease protein LptF